MAIFSILFGRLPGLTQKTIGFLPVDVFTQETITFTNEVTEHPIETGGVVTDHIYNRPDGLRVTGTVASSKRSLGFQILQTLHRQRLPVFVVTGLQTFPKMAITQLVIPRDFNTAASLQFTAEFRELEFVSSASAPAPTTPSEGAADTAATTADAGQTQPVEASDNSKNVINNVLDSVGLGGRSEDGVGSTLSQATGIGQP